ncbi:MAG: prepilin-type N-terminal cleavage/methylation domain-containing protein [candidate division WOR-3 bacterium]
MQRKPRFSSGFTIIELIIVVVILLILAAIAIPNYVALKNRALEASVKANMHSVQAATEEFNTLAGEYPGDIDTRVGQIYAFPLDPNIANISLAAGVRLPPFPPTALLRPHPGFKNPFSIHFEVIENLLVPPPPVPPPNVRGTVYYSAYQQDGITPTAHGQPAVSYIITGYGAKNPIQISLP